jgi:hypothetical protein
LLSAIAIYVTQFVFDRALGKAGLIALGLGALFAWWQIDRAGQRAIGAARATADITTASTEAMNNELETSDRVRDRAAAAATGQRVRGVKPDPYSAAQGR